MVRVDFFSSACFTSSENQFVVPPLGGIVWRHGMVLRPTLPPKGGTTNCAFHSFSASQRDTLNSSENRLRFERSDSGHAPVRNAHDQHGTFGSIEHHT